MREIKFRAWVKAIGNQPIKPFMQGFTLDDITRDDFQGHGIQTKYYEWLADLNDCELMQYTGLKDKNGKGIYEGDVVNYQISDLQFSRGVVRWNNEDMRFYFDGLYKGLIGSYYLAKTGLIGNIYENPELLEDIENGIS